MSTLAYDIVDVFTDRPFAGNPLAVVFGADGLGGEQLQRIAREFNLSETVFVLPPSPDAETATYRARIFTPETELPFAGHPSVGAAVTTVRRGHAGPGRLVQECGAGLLPIDVGAAGTARLTGGTPTMGHDRLDPGPLLEALGLAGDDYAGDDYAGDPYAGDLPVGIDRAVGGPALPARAGCGLEFVYLSVRRAALARARLDAAAADRLGVSQISVFAWDAVERSAHARVFCPGVSVPEDPATGSAALGLGVWLVAAGWLPGDATSAFRVHQGIEMRRPSLLEATVTAAAGVAVEATVAGQVTQVGRGEISIPPFIG